MDMDFLNITSEIGVMRLRSKWCADPSMDKYVQDLTSYADRSNESSVVATSVVMLVISAVFFTINLFSRVSDTSSVLNPSIRLVLSAILPLFNTVMTYLFSEAKHAPAGGNSADHGLPLRARLILTWMLLVELLRKSVEALLVNAGIKGWFSGIIQHGSTVAWLGYLVFFNLQGAGRIALFGTLWVLCAAQLVQRVLFSEIGKHSFAYGRNARVVSSYMARLTLPPPAEQTAEALLTNCHYAVMGEDKVVVKAGPRGYEFAGDGSIVTSIVTVGKIWHFAEQDALFKSNSRLKRLCLSFALFKLMRRRFEHLPGFSREETSNCRDLIFNGLCKMKAADPSEDDDEVALFQVLHDEVNFVSEYYHSVLPVVLSSPFFFVVRYLLVPTVLLGFFLMIVVLSGKGDIRFAMASMTHDNYVLSTGVLTVTKCLWANVLDPSVFFAVIDISISYLLFIAVFYEEVGEFIIFVFSNWFMVSLLATYIATPCWHRSTVCSGVARRISWISRHLSDPNRITLKQFSVSRPFWLSMTQPTTTLPKKAKRLIQERFSKAAGGDNITNGKYALDTSLNPKFAELSWSCDSDSIAEIIFTWHIATILLEMENPPPSSCWSSAPSSSPSMQVATRLSKYCSYLVGFHPELLPDDMEGTKRVYKDMKKDLKKKLGYWSYYCSSDRARRAKLRKLKIPDHSGDRRYDQLTVIQRGVELGKKLVEEAAKRNCSEHVWELLAHLWVEIIVYVAPSSGADEQVIGHQDALVKKGSGLITMLWALATHTGITRPPPPPPSSPSPPPSNV